MKKSILALFVLLFIALNSFAQNEEEMKKWQDYMTPGKPHQDFAKMDGDWTYTGKMWMDPAGEPQTYSGDAKCEMLLGGRYQQMTVMGKMMGMDFKGISINGYDNAKKVYVSSWMDNFGTGILFLEGKYDDATKKIVYTGKMFDPMTEKEVGYRETFKYVNDKTMEMEMYDIRDGKEFKTMEMTYTKK